MTGTEELIGGIYESIGDEKAMDDVVTRIARIGRSRGVQFGLLDQAGQWLQASVVGFDPDALPTYLNEYAAVDPRVPAFLAHTGELVACQECVRDSRAYERSAFVNEFLMKYEARFCLASFLRVGHSNLAVLSMMRGRKDGAYGDAEKRAVAPLLPHISRAFDLHLRLGRHSSRLRSIEALIDRLPAPVMLVDPEGILRHANAAGHLALRRGAHLVLKDGRVRPRIRAQENPFTELLRSAAVDGVRDDRSARLEGARGDTAVVTACSLNGFPGPEGTAPRRVVLFLEYRDREASIDAASLQILFGLSHAETRLAVPLMRGGSLTQVCLSLRISRETAKSQLQALFDKTGTHRQGELVALLLASVSALLR